MNVSGHGHALRGRQSLSSCVDFQRRGPQFALVHLIEPLLSVTQAVTALAVRVTGEPILPTSSPMGRSNCRIHVESIAMFETNIAFVNHLYIGPTTKQQAGANNPKI
jgi:hypothetical protein